MSYEPYLTDRQAELLQLLADGHSTKNAARLMGITIKTASNHLHLVMTELNAESRTEAVVKGLQWGLIHLPKLERPVEPAEIEATAAHHVLWLYGHELGMKPGGFVQLLLKAWFQADMVNFAKLAEQWPEYGRVMHLWKNVVGGDQAVIAMARRFRPIVATSVVVTEEVLPTHHVGVDSPVAGAREVDAEVVRDDG